MTLESAAEELVVRLKGLDSEIEESRHELDGLRGEVKESREELERGWSALTRAAGSLLEKVHQEQEHLGAEVRQALQAVSETTGAIGREGSEARSAADARRAGLAALGERATGLGTGVDSLAAQVGEAPAQSLAERAREVERQLAAALEEARGFLQDDVAAALDELAAEVRERCQALGTELGQEGAEAVQAAYDDWREQIDEIEEIAAERGFAACRRNAREVVDWALAECGTASDARLQESEAALEAALRPLVELAGELQRAGAALSGAGAAMLADIDAAGTASVAARAALGSVSALLAAFTFVRS
jgi:hypothetical protein